MSKLNVFYKNLSKLLSGTALAQGISLLALPLIARIYSPINFSDFAIFSSVAAMISIVGCLRFEVALTLPRSRKLANCVASVALAVSILVFIISIIIFQILSFVSINFTWLSANLMALFYVPVGILGFSLLNISHMVLTREKEFTLLSVSKVIFTTSTVLAQICFFYSGFSEEGLILGQIFGIYTAVITSILLSKRTRSYFSLSAINLKIVAYVFKRYSSYPKYSSLEALASTASTQLPIFLIAIYAIGPEAGYFMLANRLLNAPLGLFATSISQIYISSAAEENNNNNLGCFTLSTIKELFKLGVGPLIFIGVNSTPLVFLLLGDEWSRSADIIKWMIPWLTIQFLVFPVTMCFHVTKNHKLALKIQFINFIIRITSVLLTAFFTAKYIVELYAISGFLVYLFTFYYVCKVCLIQFSDIAFIAQKNFIWLVSWVSLSMLVYSISRYLLV